MCSFLSFLRSTLLLICVDQQCSVQYSITTLSTKVFELVCRRAFLNAKLQSRKYCVFSSSRHDDKFNAGAVPPSPQPAARPLTNVNTTQQLWKREFGRIKIHLEKTSSFPRAQWTVNSTRVLQCRNRRWKNKPYNSWVLYTMLLQEVAEFCLFNEAFGRKYEWSCRISS